MNAGGEIHTGAGMAAGRLRDGRHEMAVRVYYEDTDAAQMVYHAGYLRFAERARTELLRVQGISQAHLREAHGLGFAVRRCEIDYRAPARLDDLLLVRTHVRAHTRVQATLAQAIAHAGDGRPIADLVVNVVCLDSQGRPARMPEPVMAALGALEPTGEVGHTHGR